MKCGKICITGLERSSIKSSFAEVGIILITDKEYCNVSNDKAEQDIDTLDKENLQLFPRY